MGSAISGPNLSRLQTPSSSSDAPSSLKIQFHKLFFIFFLNEFRKENLLRQGNTSAFLPLGKLRGKRWNLKVHQCLPLPPGTLGQVHCFSSPRQLPPLPMHFPYMDCSTASRAPCFTPSLMLCFLCLELLWLPLTGCSSKQNKN